ncbi:MAG: 4Fe-4S dicluster domain-containing protein [candidate division WOR-3 bacterium]
MAKRLFLRLDYCIGCHACEAACRSRFAGEARVRYAEVNETVLLPMSCRHCAEPLCAAACPFEVIVKTENGVVQQASFHCVGCRSCALACPFGVIDTSMLRRIAQKCSLCADRPEGPRCVATCPTGALTFVEEKEVAETVVGVGFAGRHGHWRRP